MPSFYFKIDPSTTSLDNTIFKKYFFKTYFSKPFSMNNKSEMTEADT